MVILESKNTIVRIRKLSTGTGTLVPWHVSSTTVGCIIKSILFTIIIMKNCDGIINNNRYGSYSPKPQNPEGMEIYNISNL